MGRKSIFAKNGSKPTLKEKSSPHVCHPPRGVVAKPHMKVRPISLAALWHHSAVSPDFQENSVKPRMDESQEKGNKAKP